VCAREFGRVTPSRWEREFGRITDRLRTTVPRSVNLHLRTHLWYWSRGTNALYIQNFKQN